MLVWNAREDAMIGRPERTAVVLFLAVAAVACSNNSNKSSGGSASESGEPTPISITEKDFGILESTAQSPAGEVRFSIQNDGPSVHEFVVIKTDLNDSDLPLVKDGSEVDEDQLNGIGEEEDIQPGADATLSLNLPPGRYVFICNLKGHYNKGMHSSFTVT
jgi:uncharacterized cupredoxin-like copper-binding protein